METVIIANIRGVEKQINYKMKKIDALRDFVAGHYCGSHFLNDRREVALEIAESVLKRRGELKDETDFDGFAFSSAVGNYGVEIEIVV